jgi:hypothetical protein
MATEIGTLIVELRANSAQFNAEMDNARKGLGGVEKAGHGAAQGVSHLASVAVRELVPGLDVTARQIATLIRLATTATGVLGGLAKGGLVAGAGLLGYAAGNALVAFRDMIKAGYGISDAFKLAVGSTKSYEQATKEAADEQTKFLDQLAKTRAVLLQSALTLEQARGKNVGLGATLGGDPRGAATAELQSTLRQLDIQKKIRENEINNQKLTGAARAQAERENLETIATLRQNAYLQDAIAQKKIAEEEQATQFKIWKDETELLMGEYQKRIKARQDFEQNLGQGGFGGGLTTTGLGAVNTLQQRLKKDAEDLAGSRRLGRVTDKQYFDAVVELQTRAFASAQELYDQWAAFPAVERAIGVAVDRMTQGFGPLGQVMQDAATATEKMLDTDQQLAARQAQLVEQFTRVPQVTGQAGVAVQKLANDYNDLAWQAAGATQQIYAAAQAMVYFHSVGG